VDQKSAGELNIFKPGDSLYQIASTFGTTSKKIKETSNLKEEVLRSGLIISQSSRTAFLPSSSPEKSWWILASLCHLRASDPFIRPFRES